MSFIVGVADWVTPANALCLVDASLDAVRLHWRDKAYKVQLGSSAFGAAPIETFADGASPACFGTYEGACGVFDGHLRDGTRLRERLGLAPATSNATVVVRAFRQFGTECFSRLTGHFAVVIWDGPNRRIVAARDSLAVRPLCYVATERWVAVASDPQQLMFLPGVSRDVDDDMVIDYLLWDTRHTDRTFLRQIRAVPAGSILCGDSKSVTISKYSSDALKPVRAGSREQYWGEFQSRFSSAVAASLRSDFPVIAELSGGLDSSSVVCVSDDLLHRSSSLCPRFVAAAGIYPGLACDESPYVDAVAAHVRSEVVRWDGTVGSSDELETSSVAVPGGRYATFSGTDGQFDIASSVGARVMLSGVGGDQIGTPAGAIRDAVTEGRWRDARQMIVQSPGADLAKTLLILGNLVRSFAPKFVRSIVAHSPHRASRPSWLTEWARKYPRPRLEPYAPSFIKSEVQRRTWRSLSSGPHALILSYIQHHAIRRGVEVRFPFLDLEVIAVALSVPSRYWPPPWPCERLHRDILKQWLPPTIVARRTKADFRPAVTARVTRHLASLRELIHAGEWRSAKYVDRSAVRILLERVAGAPNPEFSDVYGLWAISTLEAWMRTISGYTAAPKAR